MNMNDFEIYFNKKTSTLDYRYGSNIQEEEAKKIFDYFNLSFKWKTFNGIESDLSFIEEMKIRGYNLKSFYFFISKDNIKINRFYDKPNRLTLRYGNYEGTNDLIVYGQRNDRNLLLSNISHDRNIADPLNFKYSMQKYLELNEYCINTIQFIIKLN